MHLLAASPLDTTHLLDSFGLAGLAIILFAETGLLVGFFLPGDTLLFSAGLLLATDKLHTPLIVWVIVAPVAAIIGNLVGYWIGRKAGPAVFDRPNSKLFRPEFVTRAESFFDRFGPLTVLLARFVPVVRTVATVSAGVSRMRLSVYIAYSVVGGIVWASGMILLGYWLGTFSFVRTTIAPKLDLLIVAAVVVSLLPVVVHYLMGRRKARQT